MKKGGERDKLQINFQVYAHKTMYEKARRVETKSKKEQREKEEKY